ncbi:MAG: RNA polymerase sigma factor [Bacteroidales bacterium]|nr:RNA polymerase sigma factor [Bacteroidales bacterium]
MTALEFNHRLISLQDNLEYFANTLTSDREEAKDLLQDTYLKALTNRDKFVEDTNLKAWTFTIMKNTFINNYRRNKKANTIVDNTKDLYYINTPRKNDLGSPDMEYSTKEIKTGIKKLDEGQRKPFEMHTAGYKYKEIAEKLELSIGTVKSRIFFTRKKLMDELSDFRS